LAKCLILYGLNNQVIKRKIGATILPLTLALPRNCDVTGIFKGNRYEREITC